MQPIQSDYRRKISAALIRAKLRQGAFYGCAAGVGFAVLAWGVDGFMLLQGHALFPWIKLIAGVLACALIGAAAGWLTARFDRVLLGVLFWLGAALGFAWLSVVLPLQLAPRVTAWLEPDLKGLVNYTFYEGFTARLGVAFVWVAIFSAITGLLQLPTSETAVFSTSWMGRVGPAVLCVAIMAINGWIVDSLNNEPLRSALLSVDETIQFAVDHEGETLDEKVVLRTHIAALRQVRDLLSEPRKLVVGSYDQYLGQVSVLVRFGDTWVNCLSIYNQPSNCRPVAP